MRNVKENIGMGDKKSNTKGVSPQQSNETFLAK